MRGNLKHFLILFLTGGFLYVALELLYRKKSHVSMFIDGGICLFMVDLICNRVKKAKKFSIFIRGFFGSAVITVIEFITGIIVNKKLKLKVWDYSNLPYNLKGQICMRYSVLWYILSLPIIAAGGYLAKKIADKSL